MLKKIKRKTKKNVIAQDNDEDDITQNKNEPNGWAPQITNASRVISTVVTNLGADKNRLIRFDVLVNDTTMVAMIDTGAELSVMTLASINKIDVALKPYNGPPTTAADNKKMKPVGQAKVDVNINDGSSTINITSNVMVINELPIGVDILIGQDISELADLIINVRKRKIFIASIPEDFETSTTDSSEIGEELYIMNSNLKIEQKPISVLELNVGDRIDDLNKQK